MNQVIKKTVATLVTKTSLLIILLLIVACSNEPIANSGFSLPPGIAENGRELFTEYRCTRCHTLAGTEFNDDEWRLTESAGIAVELGGETSRVQTYGDLVTSIINPSHRLANGYPLDQISDNGNSKMEYYNELMTIEELIDLVTFLKSKYQFKSYPETAYPYYIYPG
ncbi:MAG: c-type cytochrome [Arenicella sp.]|nr:c-type cytochrome [Arenicella sp.]